MSRTFRSPAIAELFSPQGTVRQFGIDPCDARQIQRGPVPAVRRANCQTTFQALGLPADFRLTSNASNFPIDVITGGNPNLEPEIAEAWSAGLVFQPRFMRGLTIAGDWVNIDLANSIENFNLIAILQACYDSPNYPGPACSNFVRDGQAQVVSATTGQINAGFRRFQGLTASVEFTTDLGDWLAFENWSGAGQLTLDFDLFHVNRLETSVLGTGTDLNDDKDDMGNSDLEWNLRTTYRSGPFTLNWLTRYIGDAVFDPADTIETRNIPRVGPIFINDVSFLYDLADDLQARLVINNVWDVEPPFPASAIGRGRVAYDHIGRYFFVGAKARF
jgi:outer membrane receptor protein involved in Fe transport